MSQDFAERARALVGTRFRPQGRDQSGLDCLGLVLAAFDLPGETARRDYRLRGAHRRELELGLDRFFMRVPYRRSRPGDVVLMAVAGDQMHFGIRTATGFVHADAGLGKVVETPGRPVWPILGTYRRRRTMTESA